MESPTPAALLTGEFPGQSETSFTRPLRAVGHAKPRIFARRRQLSIGPYDQFDKPFQRGVASRKLERNDGLEESIVTRRLSKASMF